MATTKQEKLVVPEFTHSDARIEQLLDSMHKIIDMSALDALAQWDQHTEMPEGAGVVRGEQLATMQRLLHEHWTDPALGSLLKELNEVVNSSSFTDADRGLVRETSRAYEHATKLPRKLVEEMARVQAGSFEAWRRARKNNDFASFAPWLQRTVTLQQEVAERLGYTGTPYNALLDQFEPGMTASKLDELFTPVREVSARLLRRIEASGHTIDASCLSGDFAVEEQMALSMKVLSDMGYDFSHGYLDQSPHPFTTSFGSPFDVRLTVNPDFHSIQCALMAGLHEGGHAVYEQGVAATLVRTPVASGASMGAHESQSRLWENEIGRSEAYWLGEFGVVREAFPEQFASVDAATFARALNKVEPSLIRIEADEVTYNLHIIIRYELEKGLVNGDISVEELPKLWNEKYRQYLGIVPTNDAQGVLQDMHWTSGFGYFPTYTLGNLYAAQIYLALRRTFPNFDERLAGGDTHFVLDWLREKMYIFGAIYLPEDLIKRVTGEKPNSEYFVRYLTEKFEKVYDLPKSGE